ncbi:MAG: hypothetical protein KUG77_07980 [Nannocystaceae bacterium]|nr:hypothetical protein [Nannocystaceae bacterium]
MDARTSLTRGPLGLALLLATFFVLAGMGLQDGRYLHDEGLLTHLFALVTARDPGAGFFLQKSRPPISALYAPLSGSLELFFWAHITVGALGIAALWAAARALGHRVPVLAPGVLALSPLFIGGSVAGLSNTDAVTGLCIVAWLHASDRRVAAAAVLGVLPWIRAEVAVFAVLLALWALRRTSWKELAALPAFGLLYGLAGIGYHHDPIWFLHFPPALPEPMPDNPYWADHGGAASLTELVGTAVALTPVMPALALVRWKRLQNTERLGLWFSLAFVGALVVLPVWQVFNFDTSPRYLLPVVPFVALAVGRAVGGWIDELDEPGRFALVLVLMAAGLAYVGAAGARHPSALIAVTIVAVALTAHRAAAAGLASTILVALTLCGPWFFAEGAQLDSRVTVPHLAPMVDRLEEVVGKGPKVVYTNEPLLAASLARSGRLPNVTVLYIVQEDQRFELERLANPAVGQREALWDAMTPNAYGRPIRPDALRPDAVPLGAIFALTKDSRLPLVMPPAQWEGLLQVVAPGYDMTIEERVDRRSP